MFGAAYLGDRIAQVVPHTPPRPAPGEVQVLVAWMGLCGTFLPRRWRGFPSTWTYERRDCETATDLVAAGAVPAEERIARGPAPQVSASLPSTGSAVGDHGEQVPRGDRGEVLIARFRRAGPGPRPRARGADRRG